MRRALACAIALLAGATTPAAADTLDDVLRAGGGSAPAALPDRDHEVGNPVTVDDGRATVVVYDATPSGPAGLVAVRVDSRTGAFTRVPLAWPASAPSGLDAQVCRRLESAERHAGVILVTAHVSPSAACTLVLGRDLGLRAVLAGWPVARLAGGRVVYQYNQVHFAAVHPLTLRLFDPARRVDTLLHPRRPYQATRAAHIARMRQVYTSTWCNAHNHPCEPAMFDERLASEVEGDARGDAVVFAAAFDNTTGWSDAERWGRLEPFRELRRALAPWDGQGQPPDAAYRGLLDGLARARNLDAGPHVASALSGYPGLRELVAGVLASRPPQGDSAESVPLALDPRWGEAETWLRLGRLIEVPDEFSEVVYVYTGLATPDRITYRELPRRDFEARFGGSLRAGLEPAALRQLFGAGHK